MNTSRIHLSLLPVLFWLLTAVVAVAQPCVGPIADFEATVSNDSVFLSDSSSNANFLHWDFGDGDTSNLQHPVHHYDSNGTFVIRLIASDTCLQQDTLYDTITINCLTPVAAGFSLAISDLQITATNTSSGSHQWMWDFGDSNSSSLENPVHYFSDSGTYEVCLTALGICPFQDTLCDTIQVACTGPPSTASFVVDTVIGDSFHFSSTSTNAGAWLWDFGTGASSTQENPIHVFSSYDTFNVCLTSFSSVGCFADTFCQSISNTDSFMLPGPIVNSAKISDLSGNFDGTLADWDQFGRFVTSIPSINGDQIPDLAVSARGPSLQGAVWILEMDSNGQVADEWMIANGVNGFTGVGQTGNFGISMAPLGDWNNDGFADLAVGAPTSSANGVNEGAFWILYLDSTGVIGEKRFADHNGIPTLGPNDQAATAIVNLGDLDTNGTEDLLITLNEKEFAYILFMDTGPSILSHTTIDNSSLTSPFHIDWYNEFGSSAVNIGDLNGDGFPEVAISESGDDGPGAHHGAVWIFFLDGSGSVIDFQQISRQHGNLNVALPENTNFGDALAAPGDLNGDGIPDLLVGTSKNHFYVLYLNADGTVLSHQRIESGVGGASTQIPGNTFFGNALGYVEDATGNCRPKILAGAKWDHDGGAYRGAVWTLEVNTDLPSNPITAGFTVSDTLPCTDNNILFTDTSGSIYRTWLFPGGTPATSQLASQHVKYDSPGTYSVTLIASNCQHTDTIEFTNYIEVTAQPAPDFLGADTLMCVGDTLTLQGDSTFTSYLWNTSSIDSTLTVTSPGDYSVTITHFCGTYVDSIQVGLDSIPILDLGNDSILCVGDTLVLDAYYPGASYAWQDGSTDSVFVVSQADTIHVTSTNTCGTNSDTVIIQYDSIPNPDLGPDTVICPGDSIVLAAFHPGGTYLWQDGSTDSTLTANQAGWYQVTVTGGCAVPGEDSILILVDSIPTPMLGNDSILCVGDSLTLDVFQAGATYVWQDLSTDSEFTVTQADTIYVTSTNACGIGTDTVTILYDSIPAPNLGPDTTLCPGDSIILSAIHPGATYLWQDGSTDSSLVANQPGWYSVTVTGGCAIQGIDSILVLIDSIPAPNLGNDTTLCVGDSMVLNVYQPGASFVWQDGSIDSAFTVTQADTVYVTSTHVCGVGTDTVIITYDSIPTPDLGPDTTLCAGDSIILMSLFPGGSYLWQDLTTDSVQVVTGPGIYTITVTGGCAAWSTDTILISPDSIPLAQVPDTISNCQGNPVTLTATPPGANYLWSTGSTLSSITVNNTGTYSVTVSNTCGTGTDSGFVFIDSLPVVGLSGAYEYCIGDSVLLDATWAGASSYLWNTGATTASISATQSGNYFVTLTNLCGSTTGSTNVIEIDPNPDLGADTAICVSDTLTLSPGAGFASHNWSTGGTTATEQAFAPAVVSVSVTDVNGCTAADSIELTVSSVIHGTILQGSNAQPLSNAQVLLVNFNPLDSSVVALDTAVTNSSGYYEFWTDSAFSYVKAIPDSAAYPNELPTYYDGSVSFQAADVLANPNCDSVTADFTTISGFNPGGPGFIAGQLSQGAGKTDGVGDPVPDVPIMLFSGGTVYGLTMTDAEGRFQFTNLPLNDYQVWCDYKLIDNSKAPILSLTEEFPEINYLQVKVESDQLSLFLATEAQPKTVDGNQYIVYPNPSTGTFTLRLDLAENRAIELRLMDALSKTLVVKNQQGVAGANEVNFDMQTLSNGIYFLSVQIDGQQEAFLKVVVE